MKKQITMAMAAAAIFAVAGAANAATDINIYGASAQYKFWKGAAGGFMTATVANGGLACTGTSSTEYNTSTSDPDHLKNFIIQGTGCDSTLVDSGTFNFRVSSKASYDGIFAVLGSANTMASNECGGDMFQRKMAVLGDATTLACQTITHGATDVPASAFIQSSSGQIRGALGGGAISRAFNGDATFPGAASLVKYQPVKIPFGFYVANTVTARTCTTGTSPSNLVGEYCASDADCGGAAGSCGTTAAAITNMTREMATQIYNGGVTNWSSFTGFTANPVVLCMRHAGSGTHAALDDAVMNKSWGKNLPIAEVSSTSFLAPVKIWFNDSSDDVKPCLNSATNPGGAGYLDGDSSAPTNALRLKYNGQFPTASNIARGVYDFYSDLTIYQKAGLDSLTTGVAVKLLGNPGWLNQSDNTNSRMTAANRVFIPTDRMMKVKRTNFNPFAYPSRIAQ